jgi:hypothetical protein
MCFRRHKAIGIAAFAGPARATPREPVQEMLPRRRSQSDKRSRWLDRVSDHGLRRLCALGEGRVTEVDNRIAVPENY